MCRGDQNPGFWLNMLETKYQEWEPDAVLMNALVELSLRPEIGRDEIGARLRPLLEQALKELACLERQRGISDRELMRAKALRMLLVSLE